MGTLFSPPFFFSFRHSFYHRIKWPLGSFARCDTDPRDNETRAVGALRSWLNIGERDGPDGYTLRKSLKVIIKKTCVNLREKSVAAISLRRLLSAPLHRRGQQAEVVCLEGNCGDYFQKVIQLLITKLIHRN